MAETVVTELTSTEYTKLHTLAEVTVKGLPRKEVVRSRVGPGEQYELVDKKENNERWTIGESWCNWCRTKSKDEWTTLDYIEPKDPIDPTPGRFRIETFKVEAVRETAWNRNLTVNISGTYSQINGPSEQYYKWTIYAFYNKSENSVAKINLIENQDKLQSSSTGEFSGSFTIKEDSGLDILTLGQYGIGYIGNGTYRTIKEEIGNQLTFNIPIYTTGAPPTTLRVTTRSTTSDSATITGTFDGSGEVITNYQFRYRKVDDTEWITSEELTTDNYSIENLSINTRYEISARCKTKIGWSSWKDGNYFWTRPYADKPTIELVDSGKISLNLKVIPGEVSIPEVMIYDINYRKVDAPIWIDVPDISNDTFSITGLEPNTEYETRARVRTAPGGGGNTAWSEYSEIYRFFTKPSAGKTELECVKNNTLGELDIKISPIGTYIPACDTYQLRYKATTSSTWIEGEETTEQIQTIGNLTQGTSYQIQSRGRTSEGFDGTTNWSDWSNSIVVKTVKPAYPEGLEQDLELDPQQTKVKAKVYYTNQYPDVNRIYYVLVPATMESPGPQENMYFEVESSPAELTITQDYLGNPIISDQIYKLFIYLNQYQMPAEWYTYGLNLFSDPLEEYVCTTPEIGTLDVSCIQNNTFDSLTFRALAQGNWSSYEGWQYRYKKTSEHDTEYSNWSVTNEEDKVINYLEEGETYDIQMRGSTGRIVADLVFYSEVYQMTIQVAKHPKLSFYPVRIKEDEIGIKYTIEDPGYPKVKQIDFGYTTNSYITNSYTPGDFISYEIKDVDLTKLTPQNYTYKDLYKYVDYDLTIKLIQSESEEDWYIAGLYSESIFTDETITLAMYNYRTQRMRINTANGFEIMKGMKTWSGSSWINSGTNEHSNLALGSEQSFVNTTIGNLCEGITNFYGSSSSQENNEKVSNTEMWIPIFDEAGWIGQGNEDSSYGGHLFETNFRIDLSKLPQDNTDLSSAWLNISPQYYDYKIGKTSLSLKVKEDISSMLVRNPLFEICNIERLINLDTVNMIFLEICMDVLPFEDDSDYVPIPNVQFTSSTDTSIIPMYYLGNNEIGALHKFLVPVPVCSLLDMTPKYTFTKIGFYNSSTLDKYMANILKAGSIINFTNFNLYYQPL